jgi:uncharacterized membrane protein
VWATYAIHIIAGCLGLLGGYVALYSAKGGTVHRRSGMLFVYAMLVMAVAGMTIALVRDKAPDINLPAGLITSYMLFTSLMTVRPPTIAADRRRWLDVGAMLVALGVGVTMLAFGIEAIANGGKRNGFPAFPYLLFATFGLLGVAGDLRMLRSGALQGRPRLARQLWRMSMALFIAVMSFFLGQADVIPKPIRVVPLLMAPPLTVLATMLYWAWRVRSRRSLRGITRGRAQEATS